MIRSVTLCAALALSLTGCGIINRPVVETPPARCSALLPAGWFTGVEAAPVPAGEPRVDQWIGQPLTQAMAAAIEAPWAGAYVEMGGQLSKANGRTADTISIVQRCEELVNGARADR